MTCLLTVLLTVPPKPTVQGNESLAHSDQPLKEGNVHISAPHIYGSAIEALDLVPNSCTSFLNIGSGTGYVSAIVANILGPKSLNYGRIMLFQSISLYFCWKYLPFCLSYMWRFSYLLLTLKSSGVELHDDVIEHCKASFAKWKVTSITENGNISSINFMDDTPTIHIIKGNGLNILNSEGESVVGYDRIYIGAAVDRIELANITKLLSPGGILVGPGKFTDVILWLLVCIITLLMGDISCLVDDELVKVIRVGGMAHALDNATSNEDDDASLSGLNEEFTSQILSGVRFAPLVTHPVIHTTIPSNVWNPSVLHLYPNEHQCASMALLMCSNSGIVQPLPRVPTLDERFNAAAMLPKTIWLEILSYTHRRCKSDRAYQQCIANELCQHLFRLILVSLTHSLFSLYIFIHSNRVCARAK